MRESHRRVQSLEVVDVSNKPAIGKRHPIDAARKFRPMQTSFYGLRLQGHVYAVFTAKNFGIFRFTQKSFVAVQYRMGL